VERAWWLDDWRERTARWPALSDEVRERLCGNSLAQKRVDKMRVIRVEGGFFLILL
jgi:hypothetical protein